MDKIILILKYILIAIIQGVSEIFPISSSGHLAIAYSILNIDINDRLNLTIFLHLASSIALSIFYKKEIKDLIVNSYLYIFKKNKEKNDDFKLLIYIIIACIPSVILGFFIKPFVEKAFNDIIFIAFGFLITAIILLFSNNLNTYKKYSLKNTFIVGIFQSLAIFPSISRSATTMLGCKISKLDHYNGKKLTFLLLIPISIGSTILSFFDGFLFTNNNLILYFISFFITIIVTYYCLKLFINKYSYKHNIYFIIYLIILSSIIFFVFDKL